MSRPMAKTPVMTRTELLDLMDTVTLDLRTAGRALGLGPGKCYSLARKDQFPIKVLHIGSEYRVLTADLMRFLGEDQ